MTKQIATLFFLLIIITAKAQTSLLEKLDSFCNAIEGSNKFMGSISVANNGQLLYNKNMGYAEMDRYIKTTVNTKYRIGSISKIYTATMILQAVDGNRLTLDQTIDKYFPEILHANTITIRNLLNHKSGIPNFTKGEYYLTYNIQGKSKNEMMHIISKYGSNFDPGTKNEYSNSNYLLLSYILEAIYKKTYAKILDKKIVKPLGLSDTYFGGKIAIKKNEAYSYKLDSIWKKQTETHMPMLTGAGAIVSTPSDVIQFMEAVFNGKLISQKSLTEMQEHDLGLGDFSFEEHKSYGHTGHVDGFFSMYGYFPQDKISFIIASNGTSIDNNDIAVGLLSIIFNLPYEIPMSRGTPSTHDH